MLALFDVHSVSLHEQAESLQRIFMLHTSALIKTLSDSMPLAFGHNAINPGGWGNSPQDAQHLFCRSLTKLDLNNV